MKLCQSKYDSLSFFCGGGGGCVIPLCLLQPTVHLTTFFPEKAN